jgi:DeoR/GlpR family transcriptional regulator of sugar metabolism
MLAAERRQRILAVLHEQGKVIAKELSESWDISEDTIRRDLRDLAAEGQLLRVHGGALPLSPAIARFSERQHQAVSSKALIAQAAAQMVRPGQVVLFDGGTTNIQVAQHLPYDLRATIFTNSPLLAQTLAEHHFLDVVILGGHLFRESMVTLGAETLASLDMVRADLCMLGVSSLHPAIGISTGNLEEAYLKRAMIAHAAEVIALASPEKLNTAAPYVVGPLTDIAEIITEASVPDEVLAPYRALGITVTGV